MTASKGDATALPNPNPEPAIATTTSNTTTTNDNYNGPITIVNPSQPLQLHKNLGVIPGISYVAGGIIGVGIFVSPQVVLQNVGGSVGVALCVWAFCAGLAFCGALCYAELGSRISKSGGSYTYVRCGWGDGVGFLFLWTQLVVVRPCATALGALTASEYTLRPLFLYCPDMVPDSARTLLALCILGVLVFVNSYSTQWAAVTQTLSTICKISTLVVIIVIGITFLIKNGTSEGSLQDMFSSSDLSVGSLTLAIYSCTYAYMGWDNLTMATEEVKNPQRTIPVSTLLAVLLTTVLYLLAMLSYHAVLTKPQILSGVAVAAVFTEMTVPPLMWVVVPAIAISATGIVNVIIFTSTRINFIGGRDGLFPEVLSMVNVSRRTPLISCLVLGVAASVVILNADSISSVLGAYSLFRASGETLAILGMFRLRRHYPATDRTYVAPSAVPVLYGVLNVGLAALAITRDTARYLLPLLLLLSAIPIYLMASSALFRRGPLPKLNDFFIKISRKLLLCDFATKVY